MCPIYEYKCEKCKIEIEFIMKTEEGKRKLSCEACNGKNTLIKQMSNTSFRLMGEGWSETGHDYPTTTCNPNSNEKKTKAKIKRKDFKH